MKSGLKKLSITLLPLIVLLVFIATFTMTACKKNASPEVVVPVDTTFRGVDISEWPQIEAAGLAFYNSQDQVEGMLDILKTSGVNTVRLRLWHEPGNAYDTENMATFASQLRKMGFKIWLSVHYSDTWADPGNQQKPAAWSQMSFEDLRYSVFQYTAEIATRIMPEIMQIGNEINNGMLLPDGNRYTNKEQFVELLQTASSAIRQHSSGTKIMIHYAGISGAEDFFSDVNAVDYDQIGLSYYPLWHGKDTGLLLQSMQTLESRFSKEILLAEIAYPFTLDWNDYTNNIVGTDQQLILPAYPASPAGQKEFVGKMRETVESIRNGMGFCYWGAVLVAWKGPTASDGSPWENQALFDFSNRALPVMENFKP